MLLGGAGALSVFAPLQPVIGATSIAFLAGSLAWRLRARALGCDRCVAWATNDLSCHSGRAAGYGLTSRININPPPPCSSTLLFVV